MSIFGNTNEAIPHCGTNTNKQLEITNDRQKQRSFYQKINKHGSQTKLGKKKRMAKPKSKWTLKKILYNLYKKSEQFVHAVLILA